MEFSIMELNDEFERSFKTFFLIIVRRAYSGVYIPACSAVEFKPIIELQFHLKY